jgi:hypothetical protein
MSYEQKYLKYKDKYLYLKNQQGGNQDFEKEIIKLDTDPNFFFKEFREKHMKRDIVIEVMNDEKYMEKTPVIRCTIKNLAGRELFLEIASSKKISDH